MLKHLQFSPPFANNVADLEVFHKLGGEKAIYVGRLDTLF